MLGMRELFVAGDDAFPRGRGLRTSTGRREFVDGRRPATIAEGKRTLPTAAQFAIDVNQDLGVEQRAVLDAHRPVDVVAVAERVEAVWLSGMLAARERQRVDDALHARSPRGRAAPVRR